MNVGKRTESDMFSVFVMEESNRERASEMEKELKTESQVGREKRVREGSARSYKQIHLPEAFQEAKPPLAIQLTWSFINTAARLTIKCYQSPVSLACQ